MGHPFWSRWQPEEKKGEAEIEGVAEREEERESTMDVTMGRFGHRWVHLNFILESIEVQKLVYKTQCYEKG